jgi:hypothetical protein
LSGSITSRNSLCLFLLSAFSWTFAGRHLLVRRRAVRASRPLPRKIVDVFRVAVRRARLSTKRSNASFSGNYRLGCNSRGGAVDQVRERLNRFLIERIERMNEPLSGLLSPIEITFNNRCRRMDSCGSSVGRLVRVSIRDIECTIVTSVYIHKVNSQRRRASDGSVLRCGSLGS